MLERLLPKYVRFPLLMVILANVVAFYVPGHFFLSNAKRYDFSLFIDEALPCVPFFLLIYVLAYVQWISGYIFHCKDSVKLCYTIAVASIIAKLICLVCFIVLPTEITRPEVSGSGFFEWGTRFMYTIDKPINLFPSIHCLESWLCFRGAMMLKRKNGCYIAAQGILAVLVFASTVLIKQHFFVDILGGILVCEIGLFLATKCKMWRFFNKVQTPSAKKWLAQQDKYSVEKGE